MSYFREIINTEFTFNQVINGDAYYAAHEFSAVADAAGATILLQIGSRDVIAIIDVVVEAQSTADLYEGPTFSAAGTAVPGLNLRRSDISTPLSTVTHTPTVSANGTLLEIERIFTGGTMEFSADRDFKMPWILAANTDYLLVTGNASGGPEDIIVSSTLVEID